MLLLYWMPFDVVCLLRYGVQVLSHHDHDHLRLQCRCKIDLFTVMTRMIGRGIVRGPNGRAYPINR